MKKFVVPISVTAVIALLVVIYFMFLRSPNVYRAIPDSAIAVVEISNWNKFVTDLKSKSSAAALTKTDGLIKLDSEVTFIQQFLSASNDMKVALNGKITVSAHLTSADDYDYLFTVPLTGLANADVIKAFSRRLDVASVIKRIFKERSIVDVTMKDGKRFSFSVNKKVLSFSFTSFLTENSLTAIIDGYNLDNDKGLWKALKKTPVKNGIALFLNLKKADVIFPVFIKPAKIALLGDVSKAEAWVCFDVTFGNDRINLTGTGYLGKEAKDQDVAGNILASTIWNSIPDNAAYVNAAFNRIAPVSKDGQESKMANADFDGWLGEAKAFVTLEPLREDYSEQNLFITQVKDERKAVASLQHLISLDGSKTAAVDTFDGRPIYNLKGGVVINQVFGSSFNRFDNVYFSIGNKTAIFSNSIDVLKFTLEKAGKNETMNKDGGLRASLGTINTGTSLIYINPAKTSVLFSSLVKEGSSVQTYLSQLSGITIMNKEEGEWNKVQVALAYGNGTKASQGLLWKTKLQTVSVFAPQIVVNETSNEKEIFTQDTANNIYLISKSGEIIFTKNIGEKIMGGVHQLDYYNNGSLQFVFNSSAHVFLIDRTGNDVASYPLRLSNAASTGLTLVKGASKFFYYVPCDNGAVYGYEASGRPLSGWSPKSGLGELDLPLQSFKGPKGDLFLAYNNAGKLNLVGNRGDVKWGVDNLPLTQQNFSIVQTGNDFIVMNAAGNQLVQIGSDGNDNIKPLMDSAFSFTATATSDSSYLYFFGSHHDIRSYNEKNEFKTAASLQINEVSSLEALAINNDKFILVRDKINNKIFIYDLGLKPVVDYKVMNATAFTVTDLFDRKEIIGLQPDATGNIACYRIK